MLNAFAVIIMISEIPLVRIRFNCLHFKGTQCILKFYLKVKQSGRKSKPSHSSAADPPSYDLLEAKEEGFFADATVTSESGKEVLTIYWYQILLNYFMSTIIIHECVSTSLIFYIYIFQYF